MKKIIKVILTICMILVMISCNKNEDGFKIDPLNKIDLSSYQFNDNYKYYRSGSKIDPNSLKLKDKNTYDIKESSKNINIEIKEVLLEPIKISSKDNNHIRSNKIKNDISKIISKCIPVNEELEIVVDEEITKEVNLWFYPICYEVTINNNTYRVLKMDNKSNENSIIKVKADGILEVRID